MKDDEKKDDEILDQEDASQGGEPDVQKDDGQQEEDADVQEDDDLEEDDYFDEEDDELDDSAPARRFLSRDELNLFKMLYASAIFNEFCLSVFHFG